MSNYTKATNFATKDALASGNASKIVSGTEIDDEFNLLETAVSTKAESNNGSHTGTTNIAVITGASTITSTSFVGALTGNAATATSATSATSATTAGTVTTAAQPAITSVGTLTSLTTGAVTMSGRAVDAFPSGTLMLFQQTSAPTGWTKQTTHNNKSLRVVSGTADSGGTTTFTDVFTGTTTGSHVLTTANLPAHTHGAIANHTHTVPTVRRTSSTTSSISGIVYDTFTYDSGNSVDGGVVATSVATNAGGGHTHDSVGEGVGHTHTMDMRVQYVDLIIAAKD